jgi:hypothetical protein
MKFIKDWFNNVSSVIKFDDLRLSRYYAIYVYHTKRSFSDYLEKNTLERANILISELFPAKIDKKIKSKLSDCIILYLKFITTNWDYYPGDKVCLVEYNRIIHDNFHKIKNNVI